ncbi:MAG TPA: DNA polymerase III subunit delta' [Thioalkalivibrio sp.]|nr:DNA polymerase III subunit delta' [Thioalkalivibrio sp.]
MIYPWLQDQWQRLNERQQQDRLPHGLLVSGPAGLGKGALARAFAQALLCESPAPNGSACGQCHGCRLFLAGTHPDYQLLAPEEKGKQIKVDQVRELIEFMALSRQYERYKVAIIEPADAMNVNSANSLLKTLEEPAAGTLLLLVTAQPSLLPATIRSRCQRIDLRPPSPAVAMAWLESQSVAADPARLLKAAHHAPLLAVELSHEGALDTQAEYFAQLMDVLRGRESLPAVAEQWHKGDIAGQVAWQIEWVDAMLRFLAAGVLDSEPDKAQVLQRLAPIMGTRGLFDLREQLIQYRRMASANLNTQLLLETIFQAWANTLDAGRKQSA